MPRQSERPIETVPRYLLTREEAAGSLGMSVTSFKRHVQPHVKIVRLGQMVLVAPAELERWARLTAR